VERYDVVIVGAGPTGCSAAAELDEGNRVLLIDSGPLPQQKPCGGLLNEDSISMVEGWSGVHGALVPPSHLRLGYIDFDNERVYMTRRVFWNIDRCRLSALQLGSLAENVEVKRRTRFIAYCEDRGRVILMERGGSKREVEAGWVLGADGVDSETRKTVTRRELKKHLLLQLRVRGLDSLTETAWFLYDRETTCKYSWIIPKGDHVIVGTIQDETDASSTERLLAKISTFFDAELEVTSREGSYAHCIEATSEIELGKGSLLLAGEAAGLISPSSYEGMSYALQSGAIAANAIDDGDPLNVYREACTPLMKKLDSQLLKARQLFDEDLRRRYFENGV
jgi:flavin-dependent dehydrogenase